MKRDVPGIFLVVCAVPPLAALSIGIYAVLEQQRKMTALRETAAATVLEKSLEIRDRDSRPHSSPGRQGGKVAYEPVVRFRYQVEGREFVSENVLPDTFGISGNLGRVMAQALLERFEPGQETKAYYDPDDPTKACLIRRPAWNPYGLVLLPIVLLSALAAVFRFSRQPQEDDSKRAKARWIAVAWHTVGLTATGHYFYLAGADFSGTALALFGLYTQLGLVPVALALPPSGVFTFVGRMKGAVGLSLVGTFVGYWLGLLVGLVAMFFSAAASFRMQCWGYTPAVMAVLFALLGLMGGSSAKDRKGRSNRTKQQTTPRTDS